MDPPIPLKSVVLFIACGTMQLKQEIDRRLKRVQEVKYEPQLLSPVMEQMVLSTFQGEKCHFFYRMKAMDDLKLLDQEFQKFSEHIIRRASQNLRAFLLEQRQNGPLQGIKLEVVEKFTDAYDHARHDPVEFHEEQYEDYVAWMNRLIEHIRNKRNKEEVNGENNTRVTPTIDTEARIVNSQTENVTVTPTELSHMPLEEGVSQVTYRPKKLGDRNVGVRVGIVQLTPRESLSSQGSDGDNKTESQGSTLNIESAV